MPQSLNESSTAGRQTPVGQLTITNHYTPVPGVCRRGAVMCDVFIQYF